MIVSDVISFVKTDGGRSEAGFKSSRAGDCVARALAIAANISYTEAYKALADENKRDGGQRSARDGVSQNIYRRVFRNYGAEWTATMGIGTGTTVHLRADELPAGRIIARLSKHLCAVIDGVIYDTHDPSRDGTRAVYGYWVFP